ncbi:uncharacterized protein LOC116924449 [Daphnia magna]|uniref:uncharacterized protein LOC116924449 n=1 Tax=Daphnia magna TaxID=35525 RepID=UPI001E1BA84F|nr:uncharacterized protein LOC116924449 [Daphnia magna]
MLSHYRTVHRGHRTFDVPCLAGCDRRYRTEDGLRKHLQSHHPRFFEQNIEAEGVAPSDSEELDVMLQEEIQRINSHLDAASISSTDEQVLQKPHNYDSALYLVCLSDKRKFNQVDLQTVIDATTAFVNKEIISVLSKTISSLREENCTHFKSIQQMEQLYRSPFAPDPFEGLRTQYRQRQFYSKYFGMINSSKIRLPALLSDYGRHRTRQPQTFKKQEYVVVSLISQIQCLLQKDDVYHQVFSDKIPLPGFLSRFEDGTSFLENPLFKQHPHALQIHLYLDEVQLCDALGSKVFNNKLVFVYFTIGNLEMRYRSAFSQIQLLSIFYNCQVERYGMNVLLKPIVDELKKLEQGVELFIKGVTHNIIIISGYAKYRELFCMTHARLLWWIESDEDIFHPTPHRSDFYTEVTQAEMDNRLAARQTWNDVLESLNMETPSPNDFHLLREFSRSLTSLLDYTEDQLNE